MAHEELEGKRVVVTGGAQGIGLATARRFARAGARVAIIDVRDAPTGEGFFSIQADVASHQNVGRAFAAIETELGGVDILVANAGISLRRRLLDITAQEWNRVIGTNLSGVFYCCQEALNRMVPQRYGVIVTLGSTNGLEGHEYYADYNASKAGVILLTRTIAREYAPHVRALAVCPGYVLTPMQRAEYTAEMLAQVDSKLPMKRHAQPEEVADLIVFVSSARAGYLTGAPLIIDGGETA